MLEIFLRHYKPVPERLRPEDRMVAHTGFLVFARTFAEAQVPESVAQEASTDEEPTEDLLDE